MACNVYFTDCTGFRGLNFILPDDSQLYIAHYHKLIWSNMDGIAKLYICSQLSLLTGCVKLGRRFSSGIELVLNKVF